MKRDLKSMKKGTVAPSQKESDDVMQLVDAYSGKSETELLHALGTMSEDERKQMHAFAKEILPMLNEAQKKKLSTILCQFEP